MSRHNNNFQKAISSAYTLLSSLLFCGGVGYYLSIKTQNKFWVVSGLILGTFIGMYELYKIIKK